MKVSTAQKATIRICETSVNGCAGLAAQLGPEANEADQNAATMMAQPWGISQTPRESAGEIVNNVMN